MRLLDIILETVCTSRKKIRIAGDDYPAELVKSKFMKLDSEHIRFVLDCMQGEHHENPQYQAVPKGGSFQCPVYH